MNRVQRHHCGECHRFVPESTVESYWPGEGSVAAGRQPAFLTVRNATRREQPMSTTIYEFGLGTLDQRVAKGSARLDLNIELRRR